MKNIMKLMIQFVLVFIYNNIFCNIKIYLETFQWFCETEFKKLKRERRNSDEDFLKKISLNKVGDVNENNNTQ